MTNNTPKVTIVVPTYNERENLPQLVQALEQLELPGLNLLVVDDNSPDGTGQVADELTTTSSLPIRVLHRTEKNGLGRAYIAGMTQAMDEGADIVIQMDADLSHPSSVLPIMVQALTTTDAAMVIGSRYVPGGSVAEEWAWHRKLLSAGANLYVNAILRLGVKDATAGFKAWKSDTLRRIDLSTIESGGYSFQVEMNYRTVQRGMRIVEVPIRFEERVEGASKMTMAVQLESAKMPWKLRFGK
ncbi:polyprenol monophosphomannose synthase [Tomitella biformata]|uniref:polyprenol monophosphomannose synthase n=1 Tax=Tomitella biformata TaxID=630403 RepID=UPI0004666B04|nr:polyprenol monophosphomannose synthase [Tomitella biformata]